VIICCVIWLLESISVVVSAIVNRNSETQWGAMIGLLILEEAAYICALICVMWYCRSAAKWEKDLVAALDVMDV